MNTAYITLDLGFGDSGKGTVVDALVRRFNSDLVIRYNGGCQAAHRVVDISKKEHIFSQFGSGLFLPRVKTLLGPRMMVNPLSLYVEEEALQAIGIRDGFNRLYISDRCPITTPYHKGVNRLIERARDKNRHGSCGMGIGETALDVLKRANEALVAGDFLNRNKLENKVRLVHGAMMARIRDLEVNGLGKFDQEEITKIFSAKMEELVDIYTQFAKDVTILDDNACYQLLNSSNNPVFEAAQGILLDENYGFYPYNTWSDTTTKYAEEFLDFAKWKGDKKIIGITRVYATRHGPGPFVTENPMLSLTLRDLSNPKNDWQGDFRIGWLDLPLLEYAFLINNKINYLAITHVDKLKTNKTWAICTNYVHKNCIWFPKPPLLNIDLLKHQEILTNMMFESTPSLTEFNAEDIPKFISDYLETPILVLSAGPSYNDKTWVIEEKAQPKK